MTAVALWQKVIYICISLVPTKRPYFWNDVVTSLFVVETSGFFNNTIECEGYREMLRGIYRISKDVRLREHIKLCQRMKTYAVHSVYRILLRLKPDWPIMKSTVCSADTYFDVQSKLILVVFQALISLTNVQHDICVEIVKQNMVYYNFEQRTITPLFMYIFKNLVLIYIKNVFK